MYSKKKAGKFGMLILVLLASANLFSQENYVPGYIIKVGSDTIHGYLDYRNWEENPDAINFKNTMTDLAVRYTAIEVLEFGAEDEIYIGATVETENTYRDLDYLVYDPELKIEVRSIFLQCLVRGNKELYYYNFDRRRANFYIRHDGELELLIYKQYLKKNNLSEVVVTNNRYKGQLSIYLSDCPDVLPRIKNVSYSQNSLSKLIKYYNKCTGSESSYQKEVNKLDLEFGVLAGFTTTSLDFDSKYFDYLAGADFSESSNISGGIFFDVILPRNQARWSINNEIYFSSYSVEAMYDGDLANNIISTSKFGYSYLKINNMLRFKYLIGSVYIFVNAGISTGYALKETNYRELNYHLANRIDEEQALYKTRLKERGILAGAGARYNRFSFETRLEKADGMSVFLTLGSQTTRYHFLLAYTF